MKKNFKLLSYLVVAFTLVFTACKKDDDVTPEQEKINQLNGTWVINSATTPNGNEVVSGVTITFTGENRTYAVSGLGTLDDTALNLNHSDVFAASGTFSLNESSLNEMTLASNGTTTGVVIYSISGNTLTLNYSSEFPKDGGDEANITLTATKQ